MPDHDFRKLFRTRHALIQEADQAVVHAERVFGRAEGDNRARWTVIAAGRCERAKLNQDRWAAVPTYWEDNGDAANDSGSQKGTQV